jgi:GH35 family endo-1,4-beta-xylanase
MMCLNDRYPDCYCVDVINEIAADPDELYFFKENNIPLYEFDENGIRIDDWYKLLGKDYYIEIFKLARQVFGENTKLFYNDCNEGNKEKQKTYSFIINNIKEYENKYNIHLLDGFGMQSHFWGSEDENIEYMDNLYSFYTNLDLEIQITEFDVSNHSNKNVQNSIFENFIKIIPKYNITNFTTWGLNDLVSWYSEYDATLIDKDCNFKSFTQKYIDTFSNKNSKRKEDNK